MNGRLRVIVTVKEGANPELFEALHEIPREDRSERLRYLATLGEHVARGGIAGVALAPVGETPASECSADSRPALGRHEAEPQTLAGLGGEGWG